MSCLDQDIISDHDTTDITLVAFGFQPYYNEAQLLLL